MTGYLITAFIYLCAAVIAVPVAKRLGLGSVLGYLCAGVIIGPVLGLVGQEAARLQHLGEFGVVMMLFLVGLELEPRMLWQMRHRLLGLGGLQVGGTALAVAAIGLLLGLAWQVALCVGLIFSLSSTAIVLQTFSEKGLSRTPGGRTAFSVLLFQDIAVIPMLALLPLLALPELGASAPSAAGHGGESHEALNLVAHLQGWQHAAVVLASVTVVVLAGHYLGRPLFRIVADTGLRELFTATSLALVIGVAALMSLVGLSPALGTFLAGVVLANSEFRHELESNIEPFKGLLLGLFFIAVGAGIQFGVLAEHYWLIIGLTAGIMLLKGAVLWGLAALFGVRGTDGWLLTLSLAQAGEFGFVLLSYSGQNLVLPADLAQLLSLVVALSMFLTPVLFIVFDRLVVPRYQRRGGEREADTIDEHGPVIIAGIGRFGQIVNRMLTANDIRTVVLDREIGQVDNMRKIRIKSFYGDATRPALLHTAGIDDATLFVVAIDEAEQAVELVRYLKHAHPHLRVLARARDRLHLYHLRDAGADYIVAETYHSALNMGSAVLRELGVHPFKAEQLRAAFEQIEQNSIDQLYGAWQQRGEGERVGTNYLQLFFELDGIIRQAMLRDRDDRHPRSARGWTPPPRNYEEVIELPDID